MDGSKRGRRTWDGDPNVFARNPWVTARGHASQTAEAQQRNDTLLALVAEARAKGATTRSALAAWLNDQGSRTARGLPWNGTRLRNALQECRRAPRRLYDLEDLARPGEGGDGGGRGGESAESSRAPFGIAAPPAPAPGAAGGCCSGATPPHGPAEQPPPAPLAAHSG